MLLLDAASRRPNAEMGGVRPVCDETRRLSTPLCSIFVGGDSSHETIDRWEGLRASLELTSEELQVAKS